MTYPIDLRDLPAAPPWKLTRAAWLERRGVVEAGPDPDEAATALRVLGARPAPCNWNARDIDDSQEPPDADSVLGDYPRRLIPGYGPMERDARSAFRAYVLIDQLDPQVGDDEPRADDEEEGDEDGYDWGELEGGIASADVPPAKVRLDEDGELSLPDGNHRVYLWDRKDFTHAPAWVLDHEAHRRAVEAAMERGDDVPREVLRDYPDLRRARETPTDDPGYKRREDDAMNRKPNRGSQPTTPLAPLARWERYHSGRGECLRTPAPDGESSYHVAPVSAGGASGFIAFLEGPGRRATFWMSATGNHLPAEAVEAADLFATREQARAACVADAAIGTVANPPDARRLESAVRQALRDNGFGDAWAWDYVLIHDAGLARFLGSGAGKARSLRAQLEAMARRRGFEMKVSGENVAFPLDRGIKQSAEAIWRSSSALAREVTDFLEQNDYAGLRIYSPVIESKAFAEAPMAKKVPAIDAVFRAATDLGFDTLRGRDDSFRFSRLASAENPPGESRLPFPVVYSAVGILLKGRPYGEVERVSRKAIGGAISIAVSSRQKPSLGHIKPGTMELTAKGRAWEKAKRAEEPAKVAAVEQEWERLWTLAREPASTTGPRASVPARKTPAKATGARSRAKRREGVRLAIEWLKKERRWAYTVRTGGPTPDYVTVLALAVRLPKRLGAKATLYELDEAARADIARRYPEMLSRYVLDAVRKFGPTKPKKAAAPPPKPTPAKAPKRKGIPDELKVLIAWRESEGRWAYSFQGPGGAWSGLPKEPTLLPASAKRGAKVDALTAAVRRSLAHGPKRFRKLKDFSSVRLSLPAERRRNPAGKAPGRGGAR